MMLPKDSQVSLLILQTCIPGLMIVYLGPDETESINKLHVLYALIESNIPNKMIPNSQNTVLCDTYQVPQRILLLTLIRKRLP